MKKERKKEEYRIASPRRRPYLVVERPYLVVQRPYLVVERPYLIVERPYLIVERPYLVVERPYLDVERPYLDVERPYLVVERPYRVVERPYLVVEVEVDEPGDVLGELGELAHRLHGGALTAIEDVHPDLPVGRRPIGQLTPDQPVLRLPQRVHVMDDKGLRATPG